MDEGAPQPEQIEEPAGSASERLSRLLKDCDVKVQFGLRAQGHMPTIERMRAEGASWDDIGKAIGWHGPTTEEWYETERLMVGSEHLGDEDILKALVICCESWEGGVRLLGNLRASDIARVSRTAITALESYATLRRELPDERDGCLAIARVYELLAESEIRDTDTLKHTLEDHARWRTSVVAMDVEDMSLRSEVATLRRERDEARAELALARVARSVEPLAEALRFAREWREKAEALTQQIEERERTAFENGWHAAEHMQGVLNVDEAYQQWQATKAAEEARR